MRKLACTLVAALVYSTAPPEPLHAQDDPTVNLLTIVKNHIEKNRKHVSLRHGFLPCCNEDREKLMSRFQNVDSSLAKAISSYQVLDGDKTKLAVFCAWTNQSKLDISLVNTALIFASVNAKRALDDASQYETEINALRETVDRMNAVTKALEKVTAANNC